MLDECRQRVPERFIEIVRQRITTVNAFDQLHRRIRKHHICRQLLAAQNVRQSFQTSFKQNDLRMQIRVGGPFGSLCFPLQPQIGELSDAAADRQVGAKQRSEEHTSELQSRENLVCRLLLEKKKN